MGIMERYSNAVDSDNYNITINGMDFIMEEPQVNEAFNHRELARHDIIGGTQHTIRTVYKVRDYSFKLHLRIDPLYPDIYNGMFTEWVNKPCEIICSLMGGKFDAEVIVKPVPVGNYLEVDVQVIEIPSVESSIPNESLDAPSNKHFEIISTSTEDELKKQISDVQKKIKALNKKKKTKKVKKELKELKDKLKNLQNKLKEEKAKKKNKTTNKGSNKESNNKSNKSNKGKSNVTKTKNGSKKKNK